VYSDHPFYFLFSFSFLFRTIRRDSGGAGQVMQAAVRWGQEAFIGVSPSARTPPNAPHGHGMADGKAPPLFGDRLCPRLARRQGLGSPTDWAARSVPICPRRLQASRSGQRTPRRPSATSGTSSVHGGPDERRRVRAPAAFIRLKWGRARRRKPPASQPVS
jgi:hypothetical protein